MALQAPQAVACCLETCPKSGAGLHPGVARLLALCSGSILYCPVQAFGADVMLAEMFTPCSALLAHKLDLPWINHWPIAQVEPHFTSLWPASNRRLFQPNPLAYFPQFKTRSTTQMMVGMSP